MKYKVYPKYKSSGIDWLGDIPEGWEVKKLKHTVKELVGGGTPDTGNDQNWTDDESGTPWVNIADMTSSFNIQETEKRVTLMGLSEKNLRILPKNTLLYSMYASLGKVAILDIEAVTNQAILGVVEDKHKAISDFLKWWLISIESHLSLFSSSSTQNNLNEFKVKNMPLFLPSLQEQNTIADFLDRETAKIDNMVAKKQKMIDLLKEKRQALITHAVTKGLDPKAKMKPSGIEWLGNIPAGWEVKRLKYLTECHDTKRIPLNSEERGEKQGDYPYWGANGVLDYVDEYLFDGEYVLLGEDGAPFFEEIKQVSFYTSGRFWVNNHAHILKAIKIHPRLLVHILNVVDYKQFIDGSTRDKLTQSDMGIIPIQLPSSKEQKEIIAFLDRETAKIDEMMKKIESQIEKLQEYRQALITNAVTGKIMVN